jgi:hypothetical protein
MAARIRGFALFALFLVLLDCGGGGNGYQPPVSLSVNPSTVSLPPAGSQSFGVTITGTTNHAVNWAVQEGAAGGSITNMGAYTAPNSTGIFHVIATSQADASKSATAEVSVVDLTVSPTSEVLGPMGFRAFSAPVDVTWSVQEGAGGGDITTGGQYTAPNTTGSFHVVATSVQNPSKNAIASVTIVISGFRPGGVMNTGRTAPTATVLQSGKVLVAGGDSCLFFQYYEDCPLATAELYDPSLRTFTTTGSMAVTRVFHTATLLANGKVLVTGGHDASSELYDPTSRMFVASGSMSVGRSSHTATLLANGKVLIAGGKDVVGVLATAELYDPLSGSFTATGTMVAKRASHTATLLANGKVLIVGGADDAGAPLATTELYDPTTGSFTAGNDMGSPRASHASTRLSNGNVLVTGGSLSSSAEVYDAVAGSFTATGSMISARESHIAILLANGTVLVAGGRVHADPFGGPGGTFTAELYDSVSGTFSQTGSMQSERVLPAAVLLQDGRVLVSGGSDTNSADLYK